ncbi:hypothetical protein [Pseudidiomarina andamanensis]|uniref:Signaling protein n=1 Tax=Pseudidiomarina andamanensis TaxID=1940690 RepID=A0AA92ERU8_9GAMM|nr:hypothetical protein [Pseudidiomarina andamanensis]MDS0218754.1 hypothetical protein [Pseudidiomarina andamanensis]QGT95607.1 hypothetical protein D3795_05220 [Pseudidiomarina andamanensis]
MAFKRSWRPLILAGLIVVMLALAWLPVGNLDPGQRSNKPFLYVTYQIPENSNNQQLKDVLFDVRQRIESRHEWRLLEQQASYGWQLNVSVTHGELLQINGQLMAPAESGSATSVQRFKVQGKMETFGALPEQYVKILIELVENGHKAQSSL